jgi:hypothetical protein
MSLRSSPTCLAAWPAVGWGLTFPSHAQTIRYRLSEDDPNPDSDELVSASFSPGGSCLAVGYGRFTLGRTQRRW